MDPPNTEHRSAFLLIFCPDTSLMRLHDGTRDRQDNSRSLLPGGKEGITDFVQFFDMNAAT